LVRGQRLLSRLLATASPMRATAPIARIVLLAMALALIGCRSGLSFPAAITQPDDVGLVATVKTDADLTAHVVLANGEALDLTRSDRSLGGLGELLFFGSKPARWYLAGHKSEKPDCYWVSASRAYSEPDSVVLAFEDWPGVGIRLSKVPGFDDSKLVTSDSQGRLVYSSIGPISLCADVEGRIGGLR
jgi:hypothetical protein